MLFETRLELFSVSALNNLHLFLFLRYFLFDTLLYILMLQRPGLYGFFYGAEWAVCYVAQIGHLTAPSRLQLYVIYAGPDRSFDQTIRAFRFDHLDMLSMLGRIGHLTEPSGLLDLTSWMLSMLGRIGHLIAPSGILDLTS